MNESEKQKWFEDFKEASKTAPNPYDYYIGGILGLLIAVGFFMVCLSICTWLVNL